MRLTKEDIISAINEIHGDKYDCSHVNYVNAHTPISLVCPIHGCFSIRPCRILYEKRGCQMCGGSIGENNVQSFLERNNIEYIRQYIIPNEYLFCTNKILKVDFYLPQHNTIIEYNGAQHYNSGWFFDENGFQKQKERDIALRNYCKNHHINLIEIPYTRLKQIDNILKNKLKLKKNG